MSARNHALHLKRGVTHEAQGNLFVSRTAPQACRENRKSGLRGSFVGRVTPDQVKIALGEFGDIWPESIREDAEAA